MSEVSSLIEQGASVDYYDEVLPNHGHMHGYRLIGPHELYPASHTVSVDSALPDSEYSYTLHL